MRQLDAEDRRLQRVETEVAANLVMVVFGLGPVVAQTPHARGESIVIRGDQTRVAECAEILAGKEREATEQPERACLAASIRGADGLCRILHDGNASFGRDGGQRAHVGAQPIQVNRNDGAGPRRDRGAHRVCGHHERVGVDVDEYGTGPETGD